mgnify:CR=1 FL=1
MITALDLANRIGDIEALLCIRPQDAELASSKRIKERQIELLFDLACEGLLDAARVPES